MDNGLQICAAATEMARKTKAVCQKEKTDSSASFLDVSQSRKINWMAVQRFDAYTMEPKTTRKAL
jgi:hypothetical protein